MKAAAEQIESYLKSVGRDLQFSIDQDTGETVITVRDSSTGEIVRQIPQSRSNATCALFGVADECSNRHKYLGRLS